MKIKIEEEDLVHLLKCADSHAEFDETEWGKYKDATETRSKIRSAVFEMNRQIGFEKYTYDSAYGLKEKAKHGLSEVKRED